MERGWAGVECGGTGWAGAGRARAYYGEMESGRTWGEAVWFEARLGW